jgi:succinoglycan biosynthesis transport protein ExoP
VTQDPAAPVTGVARQATAREFVAVLFRRKWLVLGLFLVTTATVLTMSLTAKTLYQSAGRVLVMRGEKESALTAGRQIFNQWEEELASEMEIIRSQPVLDRARALVAARPGPTASLRPGQVDCQVMGKSNVVAIAYVDRDPGVAQRCAQAVIDAYIEFRQTDMSLSDPKQFFSSEIRDVDAELRSLTEQRRLYATESGVVDIGAQKMMQLSLLQSLSQSRSEAAAGLAEAESEQRTMRDLQTRPDVDNPTVGAGFAGQDPILDIQRRMVEQRGRLADLRERYREDAVEVANAESTLATLKGMLRREVEARLQISQTRVTALTERLRSIDRDLAGVRSELATLPAKEARISELETRIAALKLRYGDVVEKSGAARITAFTSLPVKIMLLSPAAPATPKAARDYVRLALAPAFSIVVGIGVAFFVDGLDITVRTAGHAEEGSELPVLATVNERRRRRRAG